MTESEIVYVLLAIEQAKENPNEDYRYSFTLEEYLSGIDLGVSVSPAMHAFLHLCPAAELGEPLDLAAFRTVMESNNGLAYEFLINKNEKENFAMYLNEKALRDKFSICLDVSLFNILA